jgi:OOP family OmpA-OmpF porin
MNYKKYLLLAGACAAIALPATAQESQNGTASGSSYGNRDMTYRGDSYDVLDSTLVPNSRMSQHRKFLNHQYNFPAKPRNMWEVGVSAGLYNISGDVPSLMLWQKGGYAFGFHVRKALGYVVSLRADYNYGIGKGLGWQGSSGYMYNSAWNGANGGPDYTTAANPNGAGSPIVYNYKMESHQLNLDVVASLGNVLFHKSRTKIDPYVFIGIGANAYQTWVNAANADGQAYDFKTILDKYPNASYKDRKNIKKDLQSMMDDSYETGAESDKDKATGNRRPGIFNSKKLTFATSFGAGIQFRLTKRVNLAIEDRVTFFPTTNEDLLDGQRWDEGSNSFGQVPSQSKDGINYFSVGVNVNLGGGRKNVEPLYWLNPLDYSYGELGNPRHMILPEPILADSDGDGITDQLDKCPGTPAGVAVDAHGCPMDTDGDGVPDDRDKQLITPTECQPVDADGVGKCPCPDGCGTAVSCGNIGAGSLMFAGNGSRINPAMQAQLATLAAQMQANPDCRVVIMGNGSGSKAAQQRSWDRVNAVIEHMSEKHGIDRNRFIFNYEGQGSPDAVMYRSANQGEEGPSNVPPPHPNLRRD